MLRRKKRRIKRFALPEITLTPLIDTFATLLLIFMVAAPMVQNALRVDLPQGKSREVGGQQDLVVSMSKDGKIFFNSYPIQASELVKSVQKAMGSRNDQPVYVQADEKLSYGKVIEIVDDLKLAGVKYVAMSMRQAS